MVLWRRRRRYADVGGVKNDGRVIAPMVLATASVPGCRRQCNGSTWTRSGRQLGFFKVTVRSPPRGSASYDVGFIAFLNSNGFLCLHVVR